jgi:GNAT superfamily N-acetyltransferase
LGGSAVVAVRPADTGDAEAIARIQVAGWRAAYAEILSGDFLAGLDEGARAAQWRTRIGPAANPDSPTLVATDETDAVRGFAHTGPVRDEDLETDGRAEVYTLYVDPVAWRAGIGTALMDQVERFWARADVRELVLWVFERNKAGRAFYEQLGFEADGATQVDDFGGARPVEVRYRRRLTAETSRR